MQRHAQTQECTYEPINKQVMTPTADSVHFCRYVIFLITVYLFCIQWCWPATYLIISPKEETQLTFYVSLSIQRKFKSSFSKFNICSSNIDFSCLTVVKNSLEGTRYPWILRGWQQNYLFNYKKIYYHDSWNMYCSCVNIVDYSLCIWPGGKIPGKKLIQECNKLQRIHCFKRNS